MKKCPYCGKENQDYVIECSCGYDFNYKVQRQSTEKSDTLVVSSEKASVFSALTVVNALLLLLLLVVTSFGVYMSHFSGSTQTVYEYKIISPSDSELEKELSDYGKRGWALKSARRAIGDRGSASYEMILMREK